MCDGAHLIRDFPKKKTFYAMVLQEEEEENEAHMSSMRHLNSMEKDEIKESKGNGSKVGSLKLVEAKVNGGNTKALIDLSATHNFLFENEAKRLGIHYLKKKAS